MSCKHPAYGQHLLKLGFPANDPLVELAVVWVNGGCASVSLLRQARLSAESWSGNRDKFRARACRSIVNKLLSYEAESARPLSDRDRIEASRRRASYDESRSTSEAAHKRASAAAAQARAEYLRNRFAAQESAQFGRELDAIAGRRVNPGKRKLDARSITRDQLIAQIRDAATGSMEFSDEDDSDLDNMTVKELRALFNSYVRNNPYKEDRYYADRLIKKGTKRRSKRKATKRGMRAVLGRMNPRARPNENDIPTVKIVRKRNPTSSALAKARAAADKRTKRHGRLASKSRSYAVQMRHLRSLEVEHRAGLARFGGGYSKLLNPRGKGRVRTESTAGNKYLRYLNRIGRQYVISPGTRSKLRKGRPAYRVTSKKFSIPKSHRRMAELMYAGLYRSEARKRNPPITKRQAATIQAVLRRHGY